MQVDQNLFRPGSVGSLLFAAESRFGGAGFPGGFEIDEHHAELAGRQAAPRRSRTAATVRRGAPAAAPPRSRSGWTTP